MHSKVRAACLAAAVLSCIILPGKARADSLCGQSKIEEPLSEADRQLPYDTQSTPPPLSASEKQFMAQTAGGRYAFEGRFIVDRAADNSKGPVLLSRQAVWEILQKRAQDEITDLTDKERAGTLDDSDRHEALFLYWCRAALLNEEDLPLLKRLNPMRLGEINAPAGSWDKAQELNVSYIPSQKGPADAVYSRLRSRIIIQNHGDPEQTAILERTLHDMLRSPTAKGLAQELGRRDARIVLSFDPMDGSQTIEKNGKTFFVGIYGATQQRGSSIDVSLNKNFLYTDPKYMASGLAETLSHELLGHALNMLKAKESGAASYLNYYAGDEAYCSLIGWTVAAELGYEPQDSAVWDYLKDPQQYQQELGEWDPFYAQLFNLKEMKNPIGTLQDRSKRIQEDLAGVEADKQEMEKWRSIIARLIKVGAKPEESFAWLNQEIRNDLESQIPVDKKELDASQQTVQFWLQAATNPLIIETLSEATKNPYLLKQDQDIVKLTQRLQALMGHRPKIDESDLPPPQGQVTWDELKRMYAQDLRAHPEHWAPGAADQR